MLLVFDFPSFVEASAKAGPLLNVANLGLVADVARTPACPVDVATL